MIEARGISKRYIDGTNDIIAVNSANITINKRDFILIIGRSGSGKSTLLSMLGGLTRPSEGSVHLKGADMGHLPDTRLSQIRAETFGFIFQFPGLIPTLTALDNVILPTLFCENGTDNRKHAVHLLDSFGLADKLASYPSQLSGGEQKRVAIARSLINDPQVILADEPTGDLDMSTEKIIMDYIKDINKMGKTIIMVTHGPEMFIYANRVFNMENGMLTEVTGSYKT